MGVNDYSKRLNNLNIRRRDLELEKKAFSDGVYKSLTESYEQLRESDSIKYVVGAMTPVNSTYTKNTYQQGERIKNQLDKLKEFGYSIEFKYQGSVTNNTHIKAHSDIDILTLHGNFVTLEAPLKPTNPYKGDAVKDLLDLRSDCYNILSKAFPAVYVDDSGSKSLSLSGGSLTRKVDVVPSSWHNTVMYETTKIDYHRGVSILDSKNKKLLANTPFYHNKLLDDKETLAHGNFKKMIRLLKTLKADSDNDIKLSSYDIAGLMYHMHNNYYRIGNSPLLLIENSTRFLKYVYDNNEFRNRLKVPDESRNIFQINGATQNDLKLMLNELTIIYEDILKDLKYTGGSINKSIIA